MALHLVSPGLVSAQFARVLRRPRTHDVVRHLRQPARGRRLRRARRLGHHACRREAGALLLAGHGRLAIDAVYAVLRAFNHLRARLHAAHRRPRLARHLRRALRRLRGRDRRLRRGRPSGAARRRVLRRDARARRSARAAGARVAGWRARLGPRQPGDVVPPLDARCGRPVDRGALWPAPRAIVLPRARRVRGARAHARLPSAVLPLDDLSAEGDRAQQQPLPRGVGGTRRDGSLPQPAERAARHRPAPRDQRLRAGAARLSALGVARVRRRPGRRAQRGGQPRAAGARCRRRPRPAAAQCG